MTEERSDPIKLGSVIPGEHHVEIYHETEEGSSVRISGIQQDPENADVRLATMYVHNPGSGETERNYGKIKGVIRESTNYLWENKVTSIGYVAVSVLIGSLWVRHRIKK
jgi:hypothetical protein